MEWDIQHFSKLLHQHFVNITMLWWFISYYAVDTFSSTDMHDKDSLSTASPEKLARQYILSLYCLLHVPLSGKRRQEAYWEFCTSKV
jgi:hypothetical protein